MLKRPSIFCRLTLADSVHAFSAGGVDLDFVLEVLLETAQTDGCHFAASVDRAIYRLTGEAKAYKRWVHIYRLASRCRCALRIADLST